MPLVDLTKEEKVMIARKIAPLLTYWEFVRLVMDSAGTTEVLLIAKIFGAKTVSNRQRSKVNQGIWKELNE